MITINELRQVSERLDALLGEPGSSAALNANGGRDTFVWGSEHRPGRAYVTANEWWDWTRFEGAHSGPSLKLKMQREAWHNTLTKHRYYRGETYDDVGQVKRRFCKGRTLQLDRMTCVSAFPNIAGFYIQPAHAPKATMTGGSFSDLLALMKKPIDDRCEALGFDPGPHLRNLAGVQSVADALVGHLLRNLRLTHLRPVSVFIEIRNPSGMRGVHAFPRHQSQEAVLPAGAQFHVDDIVRVEDQSYRVTMTANQPTASS